MEKTRLPKSEFKPSELDLKLKIIKIKRVTKVVKGGRVLSFSALVVIGDPNKHVVGLGFGKGREVKLAVEKATNEANKVLMKVPVFKGTIPHDICVKYKASQIFLRRAPQGRGIIAGGPMRVVLEAAGLSNVLGKMRGSNTAYNVVMGTMNALKSLHTPYGVAKRRGIALDKVFNG